MLRKKEEASICTASGGVLRDLISLARDAGEEAYVSGSNWIEMPHVKRVVDQLGNSYLRGLGPAHIKALLMLDKTKSFDVNLPVNLELLATRRVLEYSATDFRVHPALLPLVIKPEAQIA